MPDQNQTPDVRALVAQARAELVPPPSFVNEDTNERTQHSVGVHEGWDAALDALEEEVARYAAVSSSDGGEREALARAEADRALAVEVLSGASWRLARVRPDGEMARRTLTSVLADIDAAVRVIGSASSSPSAGGEGDDARSDWSERIAVNVPYPIYRKVMDGGCAGTFSENVGALLAVSVSPDGEGERPDRLFAEFAAAFRTGDWPRVRRLGREAEQMRGASSSPSAGEGDTPARETTGMRCEANKHGGRVLTGTAEELDGLVEMIRDAQTFGFAGANDGLMVVREGGDGDAR